MKTLDEVIKALSVCADIEGSCLTDCPYQDDCNFGADCYKDALHYLKEYKGLSKMWNDKLDKEQENPPLTWKELKQMEGKPVWIESPEWKRWEIIGHIDDFLEVMITNRHEVYESDKFSRIWQAYTKERK